MSKSIQGTSLIELLIIIALLAILLPALSLSLISSREGLVQHERRLRAATLLQETQEALRTIREEDWMNIATNGTFHPIISGTTWDLAPNADSIDGITRQLVISSVFRNGNNQIVTTGGTLDPSTKKIDITVSWATPIANELTSSMYLSRYLENALYLQTTKSDFDSGLHTGTATTNTNGGEIILGSGGAGDWCKPSDYIVDELDLPGNASARDVKAIEGKAFTGTANTGGSFIEIGISNTNPPITNIDGTVGGYETRDVFIDGQYAYIATSDASRDVVIINLNTMQEVGYFNDPAWFGTAQGVFVKGNVGYVTIGFRLHTFDLSSKTGSRPELDSIIMTLGTAYRLYVVGNYAYVAIDWGSSELKIVEVTNPRNIVNRGSANVNGERGQEVFVNETGTRAYLATSHSSSKDEMFIINTTNKNGTLPVVGSYNSNGMSPNGITAVTGNKVILVGTGGEEYQVIEVSNEGSPTRCGGIHVNDGIYGVASVLEADGDAYSYIVTGDTGDEFKAILGGPGGGYSSSGIYESTIFDPGYAAAFNRVIPNYVQPANTQVQFQIATADPISGSCQLSNYLFVGPDGTSATFFNANDVLPFNDDNVGFENPARCFKYRTYLSTTDSAATPILNDFSVNYSP